MASVCKLYALVIVCNSEETISTRTIFDLQHSHATNKIHNSFCFVEHARKVFVLVLIIDVCNAVYRVVCCILFCFILHCQMCCCCCLITFVCVLFCRVQVPSTYRIQIPPNQLSYNNCIQMIHNVMQMYSIIQRGHKELMLSMFLALSRAHGRTSLVKASETETHNQKQMKIW